MFICVHPCFSETTGRGTLPSHPFQRRTLVKAAAAVLLWAVDGKRTGLAFRSLSGWLADSEVLACSWALGCCCVKASKECRRESVVWLSKTLNVFWYNCFKSIWKLSMIWENHLVCHSYLLYTVCRDYTLPVSYPSSIKFTVTSSHLTPCKESNLYFSHLSASPFLSCALMYLGARTCTHTHTRLILALFFSFNVS